MPHFKILPTDLSHASAIVEDRNPAIALQMLSIMSCDEADVLEEERYIFSVRKGPVGAWTIFQRHQPTAPVGTFG